MASPHLCHLTPRRSSSSCKFTCAGQRPDGTCGCRDDIAIRGPTNMQETMKNTAAP
jgi:hypothetical protein